MHVNLLQSLVVVLASFRPSTAQTVPPERCATGVHAILIRGQGPGDHLNVMVSIQNLILQLIPGSTSVALPYDHGGPDHRVVAANGGILMQQYIREYVASCPKSKIFLMGYSLVSGRELFPVLPISLDFRTLAEGYSSVVSFLFPIYLSALADESISRAGSSLWTAFAGLVLSGYTQLPESSPSITETVSGCRQSPLPGLVAAWHCTSSVKIEKSKHSKNPSVR